MHYKAGDELIFVTLHYCTNGLLPKPPGYDLQMLRRLKPAPAIRKPSI